MTDKERLDAGIALSKRLSTYELLPGETDNETVHSDYWLGAKHAQEYTAARIYNTLTKEDHHE